MRYTTPGPLAQVVPQWSLNHESRTYTEEASLEPNLHDPVRDDNRAPPAPSMRGVMGGGPPTGESDRALVGQIAAGMTQDLSHLFAAMLAQLELAQGSLEIQDAVGLDRDLEDIRLAVLRGARLIEQLNAFSRGEGLQLKTVDPLTVAETAARLARPLLPYNVSVSVLDDGGPPVRADASAIEQTLISLVMQARRSLADGGRIVVRVGSTTLTRADFRRRGWGTPGRYGAITVSDDGPGLASEELARVFEPPPEGGGLLTVYALMKQHRGFIDVRSTPGRGTDVHLLFRPAPSAAVDVAAGEGDAVDRSGRTWDAPSPRPIYPSSFTRP